MNFELLQSRADYININEKHENLSFLRQHLNFMYSCLQKVSNNVDLMDAEKTDFIHVDLPVEG